MATMNTTATGAASWTNVVAGSYPATYGSTGNVWTTGTSTGWASSVGGNYATYGFNGSNSGYTSSLTEMEKKALFYLLEKELIGTYKSSQDSNGLIILEYNNKKRNISIDITHEVVNMRTELIEGALISSQTHLLIDDIVKKLKDKIKQSDEDYALDKLAE